VHYSQASIRADYITAVPNRWRSLAAAQPERFPAYKCREAWWKLLEDRGLRPVFISDRQVEAGDLLGSRGPAAQRRQRLVPRCGHRHLRYPTSAAVTLRDHPQPVIGW
jgi:hypothetical protein